MTKDQNSGRCLSSSVVADVLTLEYALSFVGTPYRWGGQSPGGIDCSGLVIEILTQAGVLPHNYDTTAQGLYSTYSKDWPTVLYPYPGALVFYGRGLASITHVAFALDGYRVLEAGGGNSSTRTKEDAWLRNAFVRIRPANYRPDMIAMIGPPYPLSENLTRID